MNEDKFLSHEFADLNYTHEELIKLLKKLETNEMLTPEQYNKLINEIGLDNISTFNLDYYELNNRPTIPVRVSQLFNDRNYDTVASVNVKVTSLAEQINKDIEEINKTLGDLKLLDIVTLLDELNETSISMKEIQSSFEFTNKAIFSLERSVESNATYIDLLNQNQETLEKHQDDNTLLIENLTTVQNIHTEDINNLIDLFNTYLNKYEELIQTVEKYKAVVDELNYYCEIINGKYDDFIKIQMQELQDGLAKLADYKDIDSINISIDNLNRDLGLLSRELDQSILDLKNIDLKNLRNDLEGQIILVRNKIPTLTSQLFNDSDYITMTQLGEEFLTKDALNDILLESGNVTEDIIYQIIREELNKFSGVDTSSKTLVELLDGYVSDIELGEKNYVTSSTLEAYKSLLEDYIDEEIRKSLIDIAPGSGGKTNHKVLTLNEFNSLDETEQQSNDILHIIIPDESSGEDIFIPPTSNNPIPDEQIDELLKRVAAIEDSLNSATDTLNDIQ